MEKQTVYLIIAIILAITVLGFGGEYFTYKYYSLTANQQVVQTQQPVIQTPTNPTPPPTPTGSSENSIISFNLNNPMAVGTVNESNHTVTITVPPDTDVTRLQPTIEISQNATVSPLSGAAQDFTNSVIYTVTAQNGATQKYNVTVNVASVLQSTGKLITSFKLTGFDPEVDGYIDNDNYTITVVVSDGTDITKITPTITVSQGATVSPASKTIQDFSYPVKYTVTDVYGDTQDYTVTVVTESNSG